MRRHPNNVHKGSLSPQMKLSFIVFILLPQNSPHVLNSACLPALLRPFSLVSIPLTLLSAALPTPRLSHTNLNPTLAFLHHTSDDIWPNLAACPSPHSSLLPSQASPAITSHGNTPNLNASPLSFSLFPLPVFCMTIQFLNLLQTDKLFSLSSAGPDRYVVFFYCDCHWSHFFTKMPLLSCSLPFLLLLLLFCSFV